MNHYAILVSGPTGTGKSDFVVQLGAAFGNRIEIVNADIGSFYTQLTIGTAKPDWKNSAISHHFFDVIDDATSWTAPQFREKLEILMQQIWQRGNIPVIVGGSAFYIQAFFYKNHELATPTAELIASLEEQSAADLWEQLNAIDPQRAVKIDRNDQYRLVRALAIWHTQGQKPSDFEQQFTPLAPFYFVTLTRDRDELYDMINDRVQVMMQAGWMQEVRSLMDDQAWVNFILKKKMIGYDLLVQYLLGFCSEQSLDDIVALIAQRTRNYAKRQITFLKKLQKSIGQDSAGRHFYKEQVIEYNLSGVNVSQIVEQVVKNVQSLGF